VGEFRLDSKIAGISISFVWVAWAVRDRGPSRAMMMIVVMVMVRWRMVIDKDMAGFLESTFARNSTHTKPKGFWGLQDFAFLLSF
jgi:hypothetical protein